MMIGKTARNSLPAGLALPTACAKAIAVAQAVSEGDVDRGSLRRKV